MDEDYSPEDYYAPEDLYDYEVSRWREEDAEHLLYWVGAAIIAPWLSSIAYAQTGELYGLKTATRRAIIAQFGPPPPPPPTPEEPETCPF